MYELQSGAGISVDGGKTFKTYNAQLTTDARYGAFPSDSTWYIAAGNWPSDNAKPSKSVFMRGTKHFPTSLLAANPEELGGSGSGSGKPHSARARDLGTLSRLWMVHQITQVSTRLRLR
jgi:hypothetical protein